MAESGCLRDVAVQNLQVMGITQFGADNSLTLDSVSESQPVLTIENNHAGATSGSINFVKKGASGTAEGGDDIGALTFTGNDVGGNEHEYGKILVESNSVNAGAERGKLSLLVATGAGESTEALSIVGGADQANTTVTIEGNLLVNGTQTSIQTTNSIISDKLIELANGTENDPTGDAGLVIERGNSANVFVGWDESADRIVVGTGTFTGASTGNLDITDAAFQCGDLFASGFLFGFSRKLTLNDCGKLATIGSSHIIQQYGARPVESLSRLLII